MTFMLYHLFFAMQNKNVNPQAGAAETIHCYAKNIQYHSSYILYTLEVQFVLTGRDLAE
jgi:hypothetical protein